MKVTYILGKFDLKELLELAMTALKAGTPKAIVNHRGTGGILIGRFEITAEPLIVEYFPETAEGVEFTYSLTDTLRNAAIPGLTVLDAD